MTLKQFLIIGPMLNVLDLLLLCDIIEIWI